MHLLCRHPVREDTKLIRLGVSPYDRVTSVLVALLILAGLSVGVLTILLIFNQMLAQSARRISVEISAGARSSGAQHAQDLEGTLDLPRQEEVAVLNEPQLNLVLASAIPAAVNEAIAYESDLDRGYKFSRTSNANDDMPSWQDDGTIIPRWKRWQIRYSSNHISDYARQLDFFGIELGAIGGQRKIDYARNFQIETPIRRQGTGSSESRLYFSWSSGFLRRFDQELLERAGIRARDRLLLQFYSEETEDQLAWIEMKHAKRHGHSRVQEFLRTYFGVRSAGEGYEFYVMDQLFRSRASD